MPAPRKAGVDWAAARLAFAQGRSLTWIGKRWGVSRQAVAQRRDADGWTRDDAAVAALAGTRTARRLVEPRDPSDFRIIASGKRGAEAMQRALDMLFTGGTRDLVARRLGMTFENFRDWLADDPDFDRLARAAEGEAAARRLARLEAAGERGDVQADKFLVERHPVSRRDFAPHTIATAPDGMVPGLVVNLHLGAEAAALLASRPDGSEGVVIVNPLSAPGPAATLILNDEKDTTDE